VLAARALTPKVPEVVNVSHLHAPAVSVAEQLLTVRNHLARAGTASFRALTADCEHTLEVVARFLALLELYRQQRVVFEQLTPLGELHVRWTGGTLPPPGEDDEAGVDDYEGHPAAEEPAPDDESDFANDEEQP
jgi:segregation and condensation protein A